MTTSKDLLSHIKVFAAKSFDALKKISESAEAKANGPPIIGAEVLANPHTLNHPEPAENIQENRSRKIKNYFNLIEEPAIARVVVINENEEEEIFYICRGTAETPADESIKLASYGAPIGRLAEGTVGKEYPRLPDEESDYVKIVEIAEFLPKLDDKEWDVRDLIFKRDVCGKTKIDSLRMFLKEIADEDKAEPTLLEALLSEEKSTKSVQEGIHRNIITKMKLRDKPILNEYQGDIFRLPLNSRLFISGAPGTGKTTTLIKRLGQKLNIDLLDKDENQIIGNKSSIGVDVSHAENWIMFAPSESLRLYVKEAFNLENIPAPDERISTWTNFRMKLARDHFGILRSESKRNSFIMKEKLESLNANSKKNSIDWFSDFNQWQKTVFWEEIRNSAEKLSKNPKIEAAQLGTKFLDALNSADSEVNLSIFRKLMDVADEIKKLVRDMKESSDNKIREGLNLQVNTDRNFLDDLAKFAEGLSGLTDEPEDLDIEDDEEINQPQRGRTGAMTHYMRAVRMHARAQVRSQKVSKSKKGGLLIEWLGDRSLPDQKLKEVGEILTTQSALRPLVNPVSRYINGIPIRYGRFRRERQAENKWYKAEGFDAKEIHPLEVDILLLATIRSTDSLIKSAPALGHGDSRAKAMLERLQEQYRTQVLVDEATDFSPVQLSCIAALAHPEIQSFFACGDFNQRLTIWGTRSIKQMKWAIQNINERTISTNYRQSHQLHNLAKEIVNLSGESADNLKLVDHADYVDNEGVSPVLATQMNKIPKIVKWLALRIQEIEHVLNELPSIAVFVNTDEEVLTLTDALGDVLENENISVVACVKGEIRGQDHAVRVFNVQDIKGLEFEAVFFIGLDRLAETYPDLFDKYLYVGATRAATYLGITCEQDIPSKMIKLKGSFGEKWQ